MSWIQENKFVAGLIGVTAVVGGAVLYFGSSQGSAYNKKMEEYQKLKGQYAQLEKSKPYPNKKNLEDRETGINNYRRTIEEVRTAMSAYRPEKLEQLSPEQFNEVRVKAMANLRKAFGDAKATVPEECDFGFERYSSNPAKPAATPKLNYQLGATEWLLTKLAGAKPTALVNVVRKPLPVEVGTPAAAPQPHRKRGGRGHRKPAASTEKPYQLMPMELTFTASEGSVRAFLKDMVNSPDYFYAIRAVRVRNEKQTAPTEKDANFPASEPAGGEPEPDPFGGFPAVETPGAGSGDAGTPGADDGAATPEPQPAAKVSERILKQVLGDEKLNVHIVFDVVFLKPEAADAEPSGSKPN